MNEVVTIERLSIEITGRVQGVGFRPFIYCLAKELNLSGWICNDSQGVKIEVEGLKTNLTSFLDRLQKEKPHVAFIDTFKVNSCVLKKDVDFKIINSDGSKDKTAVILPDLATCNICLQEIFDPNNRRYFYPFTNCTQCGPRFTIIKQLPYDRCNTAMHSFKMCDQCNQEYNEVTCRRFHAQPNACWDCGPRVTALDKTGKVLAEQIDALFLVIKALSDGQIVALKGLGGFHLLVNARSSEAVNRLRQRKSRPDKPLALMLPTLEYIHNTCVVSPLEEQLLISQQAPIVLLQAKPNNGIANEIAFNNPYLGIMLPYTPLHHILLKELNIPLVATSGNASGEPICKDEAVALLKLKDIADLFLIHNREIAHRVDDSVIRVVNNRTSFIRRARGYSPFYIRSEDFKVPTLAVGAHLKNTFAYSWRGLMLLSQYIGDLDNVELLEVFESNIQSIKNIYDISPKIIVSDQHPDYLSTQYAKSVSKEAVNVQHHHAHIAAVMLEHELKDPVLGIAWDGSGLGEDQTIWGGEFILATRKNFIKFGSIKPFVLPGGEQAIKYPTRIAISLLSQISNDIKKDFSYLNVIKQIDNLDILLKIIYSKINTPITSSMGRLFDGVAAILGLCYQISFEGQAAMELEFIASNSDSTEIYNYQINNFMADWNLMLMDMLKDIKSQLPKKIIARKFHNTLIAIIISIAKQINMENVVLCGGCFQNKILLEGSIKALEKENFKVYWPVDVPINDSSIAVGQLAIVNARI